MVSHEVWQNWGRDAGSKVVEGDDGEGMRGEGMLQGVVHAMALRPAAQGHHKRADTPVEEGQVKEEVSVAKSQGLSQLNYQVNFKTCAIMSQLENWRPGRPDKCGLST